MSIAFTPPELQLDAFTCPYPNCSVYALQEKLEVWRQLDNHIFQRSMRQFTFSVCQHCQQLGIWEGQILVFPHSLSAPVAHIDMPADVMKDYDEAREVLGSSPRSSAALLRLCVQKLCITLGEKGDNINADIGSLVTKGLPPNVQKALDIVRVVGNEQVHPGTLDVRDNPEIAAKLFALVNFIVDDLISKPRVIAELYSQIPEPKLKSIENRDGNKVP